MRVLIYSFPMFVVENGSRTSIRHSGLKGNPVKIRSCPRNCNPIPKYFGIVVYPLQMPLCAAAYEKAGKFREARRPAFFLSIQSFRVKGWDGQKTKDWM